MRRFLLALLLVLIGASGVLHTQPAPEAAPFAPNFTPALHAGRAPGAIRIDGDLGDAGWVGAARVTNFSETYPNELARPLAATEAMVAYDDENFYVAIICHDNPEEIRATLHDRDVMWNEDMAGLVLDTYGTANWAYEFFTNARGVQGDLLWSNDDEDTEFDIVFSSDAKITPDGYQVEMAIPFNSLRFPDTEKQIWRATFWRIHPRDSRREYSWAAISEDNPCQFCQYGFITGIENVKPGGALELLPSVVAHQSASPVEVRGGPTRLENGPFKADAGLGIRYAFSTSVTGEATVNPDFSQVESDAAQIDVNSTFALFYPEKRPFFQEGSDLFATSINAVYTRTINNPIAAAKFTGRLGDASFAYLGAYDESTPIVIPGEEQSRLTGGGRTFSNIIRARKSLGVESFIGALATDMRLDGGGSGTTFGADGLFRFLDLYSLQWQTLVSRMVEPDIEEAGPKSAGPYSQEFDGQSFWGQSTYLSLQRRSRYWRFDLEYSDTDRGFRALNGFKNEGGIRMFNFWTGVTTYPALDWMDRMIPSVMIGGKWNQQWTQKDEWIIPKIEFNLKGQTWLQISYLISSERFRDRQFDGIRRFDLHGSTYFSSILGGGFDITVGRFIARNLREPVLGRGNDIGIYATLKPFQQFSIQPSFNYATLYHPDSGDEIYAGYVFRTLLNYQFTRELFLRMVVQYDNFSREFALEPLMTYRINPFTMFYLGSTHDFADLDSPAPNPRYTPTGRQFFAKVQYLVQI